MNDAALADTQRRLASLFRVGRIVEIDRTKGRVKVAFHGVTSPWLPWQTSRAGPVKNWSPPAVGEQVCVVSPSGELGSGFVMAGAINYEDHPAPDDRENVERIDLPDGGAYEIHHEGKTFKLSGGKLTFDGPVEITGDVTVAGKITATQNIETPAEVKAGDIGLKTHKHTGVLSGPGNTAGPIP